MHLQVRLICIKFGVATNQIIRDLDAETMHFIRICLINKDYDRIDIENL